MRVPSCQITAGRLESGYQTQLARLREARAIEKLWAKDPSLWQADAQHAAVIRNRLGWIGVLDSMRQETASLREFAAEVERDGLRDVVLLGMGGSSLAPEVFALTHPTPSGKRFFVLDSTDPDSVRTIESSPDLKQTLFLVASKSGKTIETISQFYYFLDRLKSSGVREVGRHFVAITDAGSYFELLGPQYRFRKTFLNPQDIGGRYSALSYFGLVPAALCGVDLERQLEGAVAMRAACGPGAAGPNPALELGALLGTGEAQGHETLVLLAAPRLAPLSNWIEQLVAESTGKQGRGIVPVAGDVPITPAAFENSCIVTLMTFEDGSSAALDSLANDLKAKRVPLVEIRLTGPDDLGAEFFRWEMATAVAGAVIGIDPFDEPNVQESKDSTARLLNELEKKGELPKATVRVAEGGIELYAEGTARQRISTLGLADALRTFLQSRRQEDYVSLLAFVDRNEENSRQLAAIRERLGAALDLPVLLGFGPRYLHSIGQLYKGGPPGGMFWMITAEHPHDVPIPGARYTFGQLELAQALGDLESLLKREKPVLRLHLTQGASAGLAQLNSMVGRALEHLRAAGR